MLYQDTLIRRLGIDLSWLALVSEKMTGCGPMVLHKRPVENCGLVLVVGSICRSTMGQGVRLNLPCVQHDVPPEVIGVASIR